MANIKQVNVIERIQQLCRQGASQRRIARELGVSRNTVARYAGKTPGAPVGGGSVSDHATHGAPAGPDGQNEPQATHGVAQFENHPFVPDATHGLKPTGAVPLTLEADARSFAPHADFIRQELAMGLSYCRTSRTYRMISPSGSYASVKRYLRHLGRTAPLPPPPAQGTGAGDAGRLRYWSACHDDRGRHARPGRAALSYSRRIYCEVHYRQDTQSFIRALKTPSSISGSPPPLSSTTRAGHQGRPVRSRPEPHAGILRPSLRHVCAFAARGCRAQGQGREHGRHVQDNALTGRRFDAINEQNGFLWKWQGNVSDHRFHGTEKRHVIDMYAEEKPYLQPLPPMIFPCFSESRRKVHSDGHVEVMGAYYSVPPEYTGREVWVRYDGRVVTILNDGQEELCIHTVTPKGKTSTLRGHVPAEKTWGPEQGGSWLSSRIGAEIGEGAKAWAEEMARTRKAAAPKVMFGLLALLKKHSRSSIEFVCNMALETRADSLQDIKALLEHNRDGRQGELHFDARGEDIRELDYYETQAKTREAFA